jgi:hypothetical protein
MLATMDSWKQKVSVSEVEAAPSVTPSIEELLAAAQRFADRRDHFAVGKEVICRDMAAKLRRYGNYASEKQRLFAVNLVERSLPRQRFAKGFSSVGGDAKVPNLFDLMQRIADLTIGQTKISRRNQDSLCWVLNAGVLVGKIERGILVVFPAKAKAAGTNAQAVREAILDIEADPVRAAKKYGRSSGRCAVCGRDLTEPGSAELGIGLICFSKMMK